MEGLVEGPVGRFHPKRRVEHQQRLTHGIDNVLRVGADGLQVRLGPVTSSIANTSSSPWLPATSFRALSSMTRRPMTGKVCSSSKSLKTELLPMMSWRRV